MNDVPTPVRIAVGLWLGIAVFTLFITAGLWLQRAELERLTGRDATTLLVTVTVASLVIAVVYGWLSSVLVRRVRWARAALTFVALVHVLWLLLLGPTLANLMAMLLISVAIVFTWNPRAAKWIAEVREP